MQSVHILGIGTIGEPIVRILAQLQERAGYALSFHKQSVKVGDVPKIKLLQAAGALFAANDESEWKNWQQIGVVPNLLLKDVQPTILIDLSLIHI